MVHPTASNNIHDHRGPIDLVRFNLLDDASVVIESPQAMAFRFEGRVGVAFIAVVVVLLPACEETYEQKCAKGVTAIELTLIAGNIDAAFKQRGDVSKFCSNAELSKLDDKIEMKQRELAAPTPTPAATAPIPLTLERAKAMTVDERASELRRNCFSSGICDDETFEILTKSAATKSEVESLQATRRSHEQGALSRIRAAYLKLSEIHSQANSFVYDPETNSQSCMPKARKMWAVVDPIAKELEGIALSLPGVSSLRSAADYVRNCAAVCLTPEQRRVPCGDAKTELRDVSQSLKEAK